MHLSDLKSKHVSELLDQANAMEIDGANRMRKHDLIFAMLKSHAKKGESIFGEGVLEVLPDGFGFLRSPDTSYLAGTDDIYISPSQIRRFGLRNGHVVQGQIRPPKESERYFALLRVEAINGEDPERITDTGNFEDLTPLHPHRRVVLEADPKDLNMRIVDLGRQPRLVVGEDPADRVDAVLRQLALGPRQRRAVMLWNPVHQETSI